MGPWIVPGEESEDVMPGNGPGWHWTLSAPRAECPRPPLCLHRQTSCLKTGPRNGMSGRLSWNITEWTSTRGRLGWSLTPACHTWWPWRTTCSAQVSCSITSRWAGGCTPPPWAAGPRGAGGKGQWQPRRRNCPQEARPAHQLWPVSFLYE